MGRVGLLLGGMVSGVCVRSRDQESFLFYRRIVGPVHCALPPGYEAQWWEPSGTRFQSPRARLPAKVASWGWVQRRGGRHWSVLTISAPNQRVMHHAVMSSRDFRYRFMDARDFMFGLLFTQPDARGLGLATAGVACMLQRAHEVGVAGHAWYVVTADNWPSIRVAEKNGFVRVGSGRRVRRLGTHLLGRFEME